MNPVHFSGKAFFALPNNVDSSARDAFKQEFHGFNGNTEEWFRDGQGNTTDTVYIVHSPNDGEVQAFMQKHAGLPQKHDASYYMSPSDKIRAEAEKFLSEAKAGQHGGNRFDYSA